MSETYDKANLPEGHELFEDIAFVTFTEGTWNRKKSDGTNEVVPKWDYITEAKDNQPSFQVSVFSSTDKESLELNKKYDLLVKKSIGKDGTFYGYSLKGFAPHGEPIVKKEPRSRWEKSQSNNLRSDALAAAAIIAGTKDNPDGVIEIAEVFLAWLKGEYPKPAEEKKEEKPKAKNPIK